MNVRYVLTTLLILCAAAAGCADHRAAHEDGDAMLLYRDCMNGMPQGSAYGDPAVLPSHDNSAMNASMESSVKTQREQREQMRCMQAAGWEEN